MVPCKLCAHRERRKSKFVPPACHMCLSIVIVVERISSKKDEGQTSKKEFETKLLAGNGNKR